jgi:hypothetical protein
MKHPGHTYGGFIPAISKRGVTKTLLPYGVLLILNRKKRDRQFCSSGKVVLAQGDESDVCHQLNTGVRLAADDGPHPWLCGVEGCRHANLTLVHAVGRRQSAMVDRSIPVVAKMDECIISHSQEPRAMLARGTQPPVLGEVKVGVIVQLHLKHRHKNVTNPITKAQKQIQKSV